MLLSGGTALRANIHAKENEVTYLCTEFIANEEPILDLDDSDDVLVHKAWAGVAWDHCILRGEHTLRLTAWWQGASCSGAIAPIRRLIAIIVISGHLLLLPSLLMSLQ